MLMLIVLVCIVLNVLLYAVSLQTGKTVSSASSSAAGKFVLKIEMRTSPSTDLVEADYLLIATGSSKQVI